MVRVSRRLAIVRASAVLASLAVVAAIGLPGASAAVSQHVGSAQPVPTGHTTCVTTGLSATCTGTYSGDNAWDPTGVSHGKVDGDPVVGTNGEQNPLAPQVTVSQTSGLVNQEVQVSWKNFTPSTSSSVPTWPPQGAPSAGDDYGVSVFECRGTNPNPQTLSFATGGDCYGVGDSVYPQGAGNAVRDTYTLYQPGSLEGTGEVPFYVEAGTEINSFLNCGPGSPCSIVVVPNWGGEPQNCSNHSQDFQSATPYGVGYSTITYDAIWGLPNCSWADRIVVPLSFGPTPANCPQVNPEFYSEGSPMLERAMNQWLPGWCFGSSSLALSYAFRTTEEEARSAFLQPASFGTAPIDVAFTTLPPDAAATAGSTRKFT